MVQVCSRYQVIVRRHSLHRRKTVKNLAAAANKRRRKKRKFPEISFCCSPACQLVLFEFTSTLTTQLNEVIYIVCTLKEKKSGAEFACQTQHFVAPLRTAGPIRSTQIIDIFRSTDFYRDCEIFLLRKINKIIIFHLLRRSNCKSKYHK